MATKKHLYTFFLVTLVALKVTSTSLHLYVHHSDDTLAGEECELCEYAIHNQDIDTDIPQEFNDIDTYHFDFPEPESHYESAIFHTTVYTIHFCRPPPTYTA